MEINVFYVALLSTLIALTAGSYYQECRSNLDCGKNLGLTCSRTYYQCKMGVCCCAQGLIWDYNAKRCLKLKKLGEACDADEHLCVSGSACATGTCKCKVGSPINGNRGCRLLNERFIGEECDPKSHQCFVYAMGLKVSTGATCTRGVCNCTAGHTKSLGTVCLDLVVGDKGCSSNTCRGTPGSVCIDGECRCAKGRFYHKAMRACISSQATRNLPAGAECNELSDKGSYCGEGFFCGRCPGDNNVQRTCMRMTPPGKPFVANQIIDGPNDGVTRMASSAILLWTIALLLTIIGF